MFGQFRRVLHYRYALPGVVSAANINSSPPSWLVEKMPLSRAPLSMRWKSQFAQCAPKANGATQQRAGPTQSQRKQREDAERQRQANIEFAEVQLLMSLANGKKSFKQVVDDARDFSYEGGE